MAMPAPHTTQSSWFRSARVKPRVADGVEQTETPRDTRRRRPGSTHVPVLLPSVVVVKEVLGSV